MFLRFSLLLVALLGLGGPSIAAAQGASDNAEARVYFQEGNRLYRQAAQASAEERNELLRRALEAYVDSLQIVRSRNALFNAAIVLGELERYDESFNYLSEYLRIEDLPPDDRAEAEHRRDALRDFVAVLRVTTDPPGAIVWVDRKDLAPLGATPMEVALPMGEHRLFFEREGFLAEERLHEVVHGETTVVDVALEPIPLPEAAPPAEPVGAPQAEPRLRLRNAAIGTAASTLVTAGVALGLSIRARTLRDEYDEAADAYRTGGDPADLARAEGLADRTDRFNLAADVLWGTTIALGVSAIVLYGVHRKKQKREAPEVGVSISRHGGYATVGMRFGAAQ